MQVEITFRSHIEAFSAAIQNGLFSSDKRAENYIGRYMYMHSEDEDNGFIVDYFKDVDTRFYVKNNVYT